MTIGKCYKDPELNSTGGEREIYRQWKEQGEFGCTFADSDGVHYFAHRSGAVMKEKENHIILVEPSDLPDHLLKMMISHSVLNVHPDEKPKYEE